MNGRADVAWRLDHALALPSTVHATHVHAGGAGGGTDITIIGQWHLDDIDHRRTTAAAASSVALRLTHFAPYVLFGPPVGGGAPWTKARADLFAFACSRLLARLLYGVPHDGHVWSATPNEAHAHSDLVVQLEREVFTHTATPNPVVCTRLLDSVECENPAALPGGSGGGATARDGPWLMLAFVSERAAALAADAVCAACGAPAYHASTASYACPVPNERALPGTRVDSWLPPSLRNTDIAVADTDMSALTQCLANAGLAAAGALRLPSDVSLMELVPVQQCITSCDVELRVPWYALEAAVPSPAEEREPVVLFVALEQREAPLRGRKRAAAGTDAPAAAASVVSEARLEGLAVRTSRGGGDALLTRFTCGNSEAALAARALACFTECDPDVVVLWDADATLGTLLRHAMANNVAPARYSRFPRGGNGSFVRGRSGGYLLAGRTVVDMHALVSRPSGLGGVRFATTPSSALEAAEAIVGPSLVSSAAAAEPRTGLPGEHALACVHALARLWAHTRPDAEADAFARIAPLAPDCAPYPSVLARALLQLQMCRDARRGPAPCTPAPPEVSTTDGGTASQPSGGAGGVPPATMRTWVRETWPGTTASYTGGHVRTPDAGLYLDPVVVIDATALYPNIMRAGYTPGCARSPNDPRYVAATVVGTTATAAMAATDGDPTMGGLRYALDEAASTSITRALTTLIEMQAGARTRAHAAACKVARSAMYGCLGQRGGPLYSPRTAAAVCAVGRAVIQLSERLVSHWDCGGDDTVRASVIYGDTDSVFVRFECTTEGERVDRERAAALGVRLAHWLGERVGAHLALAPHLHFKAETLFLRLLMTDKAKHYAGRGHALSVPAAEAALGPLETTIKGLQPVRRDCTPLTSSLYARVLDLLLDVETPRASLRTVCAHLVRTLEDTIAGRIASPAELVSSVLLGDNLLKRARAPVAPPPPTKAGARKRGAAAGGGAQPAVHFVRRLLAHPVLGSHMLPNKRVGYIVASDGTYVQPAEVLLSPAADFAPQWRWYVREARTHLADLLEPLVGHMGVVGAAAPRNGAELLERLLDSIPRELESAAWALPACHEAARAGSETPLPLRRGGASAAERHALALYVRARAALALTSAGQPQAAAPAAAPVDIGTLVAPHGAAESDALLEHWAAALREMARAAAAECTHTSGGGGVCLLGTCRATWTRWRAERDLRVLETLRARM